MSVSRTASTPAEAKSIADVIPAGFTALVDQLTNLTVTNPDAALFTIVDGPLVHKQASVTRLALSTFSGVVIGLATALAQRGQRCSSLTPVSYRVALRLRWSQSPPQTTPPKVVNGQIPLATAVGKTTIPNLSLLGLGEDLHTIVEGNSGHGLTIMLDVTHSQYDTVLVDSAPMPSPAHVPTCVEDADAVLLVVDQYETKLDQSSAAVDGLRAMSEAHLGLVIDRAVRRSVTTSRFEISRVRPQTPSFEKSFDNVRIR